MRARVRVRARVKVEVRVRARVVGDRVVPAHLLRGQAEGTLDVEHRDVPHRLEEDGQALLVRVRDRVRVNP